MPLFLRRGSVIKKQIIINADDFGLSRGINQGIIKCYQAGVLSRISFITNTDFFDYSVDLLKSNCIKEIGIHLTLVGLERPLSNNLKGLVDKNGLFFSNYTTVIKNIIFKKVEPENIEEEFQLQIKRVLEKGFKVSHLDSHRHLHLFPVISDIVLKLAIEYEVPYIRCPYLERKNIRSIIVNRFSKELRKKIRNLNLITSEYFKGFDFSGHLDEKKLLGTLNSLKEGTTELMVHPGIGVDEVVFDRYRKRFDRNKEMNALLSSSIQSKIRI